MQLATISYILLLLFITNLVWAANDNYYNKKLENSYNDGRRTALLKAADETVVPESDARTAWLLKRRRWWKRRYGQCRPFGRAADNEGDAVEGRFLNFYNMYYPAGGCAPYGGYGYDYDYGGGGGGGLYADAPPAATAGSTLLSILLNSLAATARPQHTRPIAVDEYPADSINSELDDNAYDVTQRPIRRRRPPSYQQQYESVGTPPLTPAQLIGGVSTTVNGIIQQLTGNVQPVYNR